ncbi:GNAT family N-acetyltransferase [Gloeocapsopsis dulcis]|uniref:GNAT family N-acetyltransferase n=1 Tax=Gloeocapsopsis dulcis AAB1 = 1H9 TaxID=1433147 RepID=A0A6N8FQE3_9CHRO|nr:GNAT family N-acetyltransferase [Gloeocapsopsis dulcis]MUL35179.1 GNAT family N-acetyltransferase [Gloeocapsopsis dulcis AAB1 = 1H9]WNN89064.1 GNAT family N-acetyltransferase [Gloeocapsopsis dulcis]
MDKRHQEKFSSDRLTASPLCAADFSILCQMHQDPNVMATLNGIRSHEQTKQYLHKNLEHWQRYGYGLWMFRDTDGNFVGRGGLRKIYIDGNDEIELAYALMPAYWGKGLATEMAKAILKVGFEYLDIAEVVCFTLTINQASQRVMQKVGFQYKRDIIHANLPHVLYRLTCIDWQRCR